MVVHRLKCPYECDSRGKSLCLGTTNIVGLPVLADSTKTSTCEVFSCKMGFCYLFVFQVTDCFFYAPYYLPRCANLFRRNSQRKHLVKKKPNRGQRQVFRAKKPKSILLYNGNVGLLLISAQWRTDKLYYLWVM